MDREVGENLGGVMVRERYDQNILYGNLKE